MNKKKIQKNTAVKDYVQTLLELKKQVQESQVKAALSANKELIKLYWNIGKIIAEKQKNSAWGSNIIERLALDLQNEFPGMSGFSRANLFRMKSFYLIYEKVAQVARQFEELPFFNIPWFHNVIIMQRVKSSKEQFWYAQKSIENGWSRSILEMQIKSNLYKREGRAITNFSRTLPAVHSDMAQQSLKDPYVFDFLTLREGYLEKELEDGLIDHIQRFLKKFKSSLPSIKEIEA